MADDDGGGRNPAGSTAAITLDQLIALNDEITALARAGMPLERGLLQVGADLPGRLKAITTDLGRAMSRGASLPEALAASDAKIPRVYRAVVEAGLRAGRLPVALEGLATFARNFAESRRAVGLALFYPLIVLTLAYVLFLGILYLVIPKFLSAFETLEIIPGWPLRMLGRLAHTAPAWCWVVPAFIGAVVIGWLASARGVSLDRGSANGLFGWLPWFRTMLRSYQTASFADLLALLIEHGVPLHEAVVVAGEGSGDPGLAKASRELAASLAAGESADDAVRGHRRFPPLLRWLLATAPQQSGGLVESLRQLARRHRSKAEHAAEKIRVVLPLVLLLLVGASAALIYTLALFVPLTELWNGLANQAP